MPDDELSSAMADENDIPTGMADEELAEQEIAEAPIDAPSQDELLAAPVSHDEHIALTPRAQQRKRQMLFMLAAIIAIIAVPVLWILYALIAG